MQTALEPRYLLFILPIIMALAILILQAIGLLGDSIGMDFDGDGVDDIDLDESGSSFDPLGFLGVGKIPLSMIILLMLLLWGGGGLITLILLEGVIPYGFITVWPALAVAAICAFFGTAWLAKPIAHIMPKDSTAGVVESDLLFYTGKVREPISSTGGSVRVADDFGNSHVVEARVQEGESPIPVGLEVTLWRYDDKGRLFFVQSVN